MRRVIIYIITIFNFLLSLNSASQSLHHQVMDFISTHPPKEMFKLWHYLMKKPYDLNTNTLFALEKYKNFKVNLGLINYKNSLNLSYKLGLGPFTDYSKEEFLSLFKPHNKDQLKPLHKETFENKNIEDLEYLLNLSKREGLDGFDWSEIYPTAKNQLECDSCWAFAAVGTIEGDLGKKKYISLSEQQLVECSRETSSCNEGHITDLALDYVIRNQGISSSKDYPYTGIAGSCNKTVNKAVKIRGYFYCDNANRADKVNTPNCTEQMIIKLINKGPYASDIQVVEELAHYREGDFIVDECTKTNHSVIVVQYTGTKFKIRNSWGSEWGMNGYAYIQKEYPGTLSACGLLDSAYQARGSEIIKNK